MTTQKRPLGRGLNELLSQIHQPKAVSSDAGQADASPVSELQRLPIGSLQPGIYQPRRDMDFEALNELADSIKAQGIIQPIIVRYLPDGKYEIIAGERRWRAAQLAGLVEVPVIIKAIPDEAAIAMALIENIQREDLNAIEEAVALKRLGDEFNLTHQEIADAVGKSRATVSNLLRLLDLNPEVRTLLEHGDIEMGHARALLTLSDSAQSEVAKQVVTKSLSVRETENLARKWHADSGEENIKFAKRSTDPNIMQLERELGEKLGANVQVQHQPSGKGKIIIHYYSPDELQGFLDRIK